MNTLTRQIIDYSATDEGSEARNSFYAALHDKVTSHLQAQKEIIAKNLITQQEVQPEVEAQ
jgi:hypothetical protein